MAKTVVVKEPEGDRAPFLRGILIQSLVTKGLSFDEAFELAQAIREDIKDTEEITSKELRARVVKRLEDRHGSEFVHAYETEPQVEKEIIVHTTTRSAPFSVGILTHCLESCAIGPNTALDGARRIHETLKTTGHTDIGHRALRRIIYDCLIDHGDKEAAKRYLTWRQFQNSAEPLIMLIGGATGSGKSTITAEVAYRMDIVRTQSTDMIREIIRSYLAPHVVPTLGFSSFEAWRGLPEVKRSGRKATTSGRRAGDNPVIAGFLSQFINIKVALEASVARAVDERQHLIVDGVHVLPWELDLEEIGKQAIVVPLMLATMRKKLLSKQLKRRGREQTARAASRYLAHLDDIWELQSYLLSEADQASIPIIPNWTTETTVREVLELASQIIMKRYPPDPRALQ